MDLSQLDVVILCGGMGTRLRSVIGESQKVMAEVDGRPFLDVIIDDIKSQGAQRFVLCTGFCADDVEAHYKVYAEQNGCEIEFSREENPLGTGGAIKNASGFVKSDVFFAMNGDSYCSVDFSAFYAFHQAQKGIASIAISEVENKEECGSILLDEKVRVTQFLEKSKQSSAGYVNAGVYCFEQKVFDLMPDDEKFSLEYDVFPRLIEQGLYGFQVDKSFHDIGTPERYRQAKDKI